MCASVYHLPRYAGTPRVLSGHMHLVTRLRPSSCAAGVDDDSGASWQAVPSGQVPSGPKGWRRMRGKQEICVQMKVLICTSTVPQLKIKLGKHKRKLVLGQLIFQ